MIKFRIEVYNHSKIFVGWVRRFYTTSEDIDEFSITMNEERAKVTVLSESDAEILKNHLYTVDDSYIYKIAIIQNEENCSIAN